MFCLVVTLHNTTLQNIISKLNVEYTFKNVCLLSTHRWVEKEQA